MPGILATPSTDRTQDRPRVGTLCPSQHRSGPHQGAAPEGSSRQSPSGSAVLVRADEEDPIISVIVRPAMAHRVAFQSGSVRYLIASGNQAIAYRPRASSSASTDSHLAVRAEQVGFHGAHTEDQCLCDLAVAMSGRDETNDFRLTGGESRRPPQLNLRADRRELLEVLERELNRSRQCQLLTSVHSVIGNRHVVGPHADNQLDVPALRQPEVDEIELTSDNGETYPIWVNGNGEWMAGHVIGRQRCAHSLSFHLHAGDLEPETEAVAKGNGNAAKGNKDLLTCEVAETIPGEGTLDGLVVGFIPGALKAPAADLRPDESTLSEWMDGNARVTWAETPEPRRTG